MMYSLRNRTRKDYLKELGYLDLSSENMAPKKHMKIALTRLSILENHINHDKTFFVKNDGSIEVKGTDFPKYNWKNIYILVVTVLVLLTVFYFKDECHTYSQAVMKRIVILPAKQLRPFLSNVNLLIGNTVYTIKNKYSGQLKNLLQMNTEKSLKRKKIKRKSDMCYNDFEDIVFNDRPNQRFTDNSAEQRGLSFIEEQCRITKVQPKLADNFDIFLNSSGKSFDVDSLPDFASYAKGGRIISVIDTEPYVKYKVRAGVFKYVLGIEHFNINPGHICGLSSMLCEFFVNGPSSVLQPCTKPGDCWSFKGSRGRLQIKLSDRIYITAISLEHIPLKFASPTSNRSAPKIFSIIGIDDSEGYGLTSRVHLGTYEYRLSKPNIQTFSLSEVNTNNSFKIIEFIVESNHGNENFTCVYRLRVHGHKEKLL